jgi:hypothetical protein
VLKENKVLKEIMDQQGPKEPKELKGLRQELVQQVLKVLRVVQERPAHQDLQMKD